MTDLETLIDNLVRASATLTRAQEFFPDDCYGEGSQGDLDTAKQAVRKYVDEVISENKRLSENLGAERNCVAYYAKIIGESKARIAELEAAAKQNSGCAL